jgi:hypothetical protein
MSALRPGILLALTLTLVPACGHKGPPLPPRRRTPPALSNFRLAQRGAALEISCTAPSASVEGVAFDQVGIELLWGEGWVDLEEKGRRRVVRADPGARVVETVPLPPPGTLVRAAGRATVGRDKGQRSLILALETHEPLSPPSDLTARLRTKGVGLSWRGVRPEKIPPPDLGPAGPTRPAFAPGLRSGRRETRARGGPPARDAASEGAEEASAEQGVEREMSEAGGPDATAAQADERSPSRSAGEAASPEEEGTEDLTLTSPLPRSHGFRVYRRVQSSTYGAPLNDEPLERRLFTDEHPPLDTTACYTVRAVGSVEPLIESAPSNEVCLEVRDITPPPPPSGLAVIPREGGLEVVWSPSSERDVAGYRIYRATGEGEAESVGEVPADITVWLDPTPESGVLYSYTVSAFDQAGNESPPSGAAQGRGP